MAGYSGGVVDVVPLAAAQRFDRAVAQSNPDLKAAQAALSVARENVVAQRGAYYPCVTGGFSATRAKSSSNLSPVTNTSALNYSFYTPEVSVSFVPDVFGLNRRTVESLQAQEQLARFALAATHITLSANVAGGAIQEASLRAQIDATHELITINTDMLEILRTQLAKGYVEQARCGGARIATRASHRYLAAPP